MIDLSLASDPRKPVMDWMRSKDNPYFARAFVNRVWANYFGRGIVNPPDDMNQANPPATSPPTVGSGVTMNEGPTRPYPMNGRGPRYASR